MGACTNFRQMFTILSQNATAFTQTPLSAFTNPTEYFSFLLAEDVAQIVSSLYCLAQMADTLILADFWSGNGTGIW